MKHYLIAVSLVLFSSMLSPVSASPTPQDNRDYTATAPGPAHLLKEGITGLTRFIQSGAARDRNSSIAFLKDNIAPYFDFGYMARWAAGPAWRNMPEDQRARMQEQITVAFLGTLARNLSSYSNQQIRYFTPRGQKNNDVRVNAWIMQPNGYPTRLEFRFYRSTSGWKVFDVKANGNSAVVHYRNQFRHMYRTALNNRPAG